MPDRYIVENQFIEAVKRHCWTEQLDNSWESAIMRMTRVYAKALADVLDAYLPAGPQEDGKAELALFKATKLAEALELVGQQVAEHNRVLVEASAQAEQLDPHVTCYCGWSNQTGVACAVCGRRQEKR